MDPQVDFEKSEKSSYPSPADFEAFLPWACCQNQVEPIIQVLRSELAPITIDKKGGGSTKAKDHVSETDLDEKESQPSVGFATHTEDKIVNIEAIYDQNGHLVKLMFLRNESIPRKLLKIISLIIPFYPYLAAVCINRGLRCGGLYELTKIVSLSKITEVVLDDTVILEANYHELLDKDSSIKYLSLARCKLDDKVVEAIASKLLTSPLSILNLTANRITDVGATYLGNVLRSNRKLTYLNLAGNMITDTGAISILSCLMEFTLSKDEIIDMKVKKVAYLRENNNLMTNTLNNIHTVHIPDSENKGVKRKPIKQSQTSIPKKQKGHDNGSKNDPISLTKVEDVAECLPFQHPFSHENTVIRDGINFCLGNNALCYLSLAYNNLTYFSVKKLYDVICAQEDLGRSPRGLITVNIEGNNLPEGCPELTEIDFILKTGLATKVSSLIKKKPAKLNIK